MAETPETGSLFVAWLRDEGVNVCCFDFGGTLYDFQPIHVSAFCDAIGVQPGSAASRKVRDLVSGYLRSGFDSIEMAMKLTRELVLTIDPVKLTIAKRRIVEQRTRGSRLSESAAAVLRQTIERCHVFVVTRGLEVSTREILERSLDDKVAGRISVYGRHDLSSRVNKAELLRAGFSNYAWKTEAFGYVGDSDEDDLIARSLGIRFFRGAFFRPLSALAACGAVICSMVVASVSIR